jgi:hypothetical protein
MLNTSYKHDDGPIKKAAVVCSSSLLEGVVAEVANAKSRPKACQSEVMILLLLLHVLVVVAVATNRTIVARASGTWY